ncbi:endoplasmic oxidoreductin [Polychaeton citri CBS 116435]|uniref:Endoplasmic oxidoreductin n=1 Tax=Polychaeton citri CBS 116435 TaxID=1314669 RepID=A0A9P4PXH9_9PEZI|nr:endoplasmic oxidoreductin [Polychaeton citri CBS 116435]
MHRNSAVKAFYLAIFALFDSHAQVRAATPSSQYSSPDVCALEPKAKVSDACASYADLDSLNDRLHPYVRNLANNTDFFSYYRLNLYNKKCPFWSDENGLCGNIACAVTTLENEEDIPQVWRAEELSRLEGPKAQHPGKQQQQKPRPLMGELGEQVGESCVVEYDDECDERDYCVPEDESVSAKGDYVSLADNPERFTGYAGEGAHQVWEAIYRENCFSKPQVNGNSVSMPGWNAPAPGFLQNQAQAAQDFKQVMRAHDRKQAIDAGSSLEASGIEDECLEKRVFYRVISGMHASISTHLCHDHLNQTTGEWGPNLQCYKERLHEHPERISNLYFNYAFVLRAVGKLRDYVQDYTFCTGDPAEDAKTKAMIQRLANVIPEGPKIFDERVMFQDQPSASGLSLKEDFRNRFRNVSRVMDCVGCDKCRLWGKLQTNGFGTALKVLFEFGNGEGGEKPLLRRTELVALINTLDKISVALKALDNFRDLMVAEGQSEGHGKSHPAAASSPRSSAPKSKSVDDQLDDLDDFEEFDPSKESDDGEPSIVAMFSNELSVVYQACIWVLKTWVQAPWIAWGIGKYEAQRFWYYWLGYDLPAREWTIPLPPKPEFMRNEL